jgi:hypothetical protein
VRSRLSPGDAVIRLEPSSGLHPQTESTISLSRSALPPAKKDPALASLGMFPARTLGVAAQQHFRHLQQLPELLRQRHLASQFDEHLECFRLRIGYPAKTCRHFQAIA